ncbi:MAG: DUF1538 family protein [Acidobacteria bacterium]|nr:DUF1538 family protein [Acidobacteriota bacterium]
MARRPSIEMTYEQLHGEGRIRVSFAEACTILGHHFRARLVEQLRSVLPVIAYLLLFQVVILRTSILHSIPICLAVLAVVIGLLFFMDGLRLWLMPVGEAIGNSLPKRTSLPTILGFAFLVGVGATYAEPAMGALRAAGAGIDEAQAPLLHALLNRYAGALAAAVAAAVGTAVLLGTLRFLLNWPLKRLLVPIVLLLLGLTAWAYAVPALRGIIGLAWDFGAVIVGPITVPLVLGLGLGVCNASGRVDTGMSGFGAVTLISLFPILATLGVAFLIHYSGAAGHGVAAVAAAAAGPGAGAPAGPWLDALISSSQAILPLTIFLFAVQVFLLRERIAAGDEVAVGLSFALFGLVLFNVGLAAGLTPLGDQVGGVAPGAFARVLLGTPPVAFGPLYGSAVGKGIILVFALLLGYGATLAEPALNSMGLQVEQITVGAFRKALLVQAVAFGVGAGMALGVARIIFEIPFAWLLVPTYLLLLVLSLVSTEEFVSIGWDAGATTTGPFTVPLVVAIGLGLSGNLPGAADGFGILSLASAGPVVSVLTVGLLLRTAPSHEPAVRGAAA